MRIVEVVVLRFGRSLYAIVTLVVACSLFIVGLANWQDSGTGEGWRFAGYMQRTPVVPACYVVVAMGVILLGWCWLRLAGAIMSIAKLFEDDRAGDADGRRGFFALPGMAKTGELCKAINERFDDCAARIARYEKQIEDLQIQIQLSQRRERNAEAIIYSIRDAVIVVDEFDKLLMANESAGRLFNFDFTSSQHKHISELIGADEREFADFISHSRQSKGRATRQEFEFSDGGERKTFDCIVSCVYDQSQQVCGVVAVLHDVTREKQIQQMKSDFVSHVSHELKTPLASITAYSEMLVDGETHDEETRKEYRDHWTDTDHIRPGLCGQGHDFAGHCQSAE